MAWGPQWWRAWLAALEQPYLPAEPVVAILVHERQSLATAGRARSLGTVQIARLFIAEDRERRIRFLVDAALHSHHRSHRVIPVSTRAAQPHQPRRQLHLAGG